MGGLAPDRKRPRYGRLGVTGAALGIASLLKLSGFVLVAAVFAVVAVRALRERDRSWLHWAWLLAATLVTATVVINAGYGFSGTFAPLARARLAEGGALGSCGTRRPGCGCRCRFSSSTASTW